MNVEASVKSRSRGNPCFSSRLTRMSLSGFMLVTLSWASCGYFETGYFQTKVNQATQEVVAKRYGAPDKMEMSPDGGSVWTYYDRGSATASYTGYSMNKFCRAYVLTFDKEGTLRDWAQQNCRN
jgi:hypothetical protein